MREEVSRQVRFNRPSLGRVRKVSDIGGSKLDESLGGQSVSSHT